MSEAEPNERSGHGGAAAPIPQKHRNPAIERMAVILSELERAPDGLDLATVTQRSGISRSSAYRILNSLEHHGYVRRSLGGAYVLGPRLFALGEIVSRSFQARVLPDLLRDWMERLALETGETVRLSAHDRGTILLIGAAIPSSTHALSADIGQQVPPHAGGASKVLLAHMTPDERRLVLSAPLERMTDRTITDLRALDDELERIRSQGWALDPGEFSTRVQSCAVPLRGVDGTVVAAVSVAYAATEDTRIRDTILAALQRRIPEAESLIAGH